MKLMTLSSGYSDDTRTGFTTSPPLSPDVFAQLVRIAQNTPELAGMRLELIPHTQPPTLVVHTASFSQPSAIMLGAALDSAEQAVALAGLPFASRVAR